MVRHIYDKTIPLTLSHYGNMQSSIADNKNMNNEKEKIIEETKKLMWLVRQKTLIRDYLDELIKKPKSIQELIKERDNISLKIEKLFKEIKENVEKVEKLNGKK